MDTTFASSSVARHLVRGAVGLGLLVAALVLLPAVGPLSLLLLVPAGFALRGCPTCWALGLAQTLALRDSRCADGTCGTDTRAARATEEPRQAQPARV